MNQPNLQSIPTVSSQSIAAAHAYMAAKMKLDVAKRSFAEAEKNLLDLVGHKEEGSLSVVIDDHFKVTTTGKVNRKLLPEAFGKIRDDIPSPLLNRLVRTEEKLNVRELKYIENNEPETYRFLSSAIETKPAKPALKVEQIDA